MKNFKIKQTYLILLIVIGLASLAIYSTYALFTTSTEIEDVVEFSTSLTVDTSITEYEMVTVPAGETKIIELNLANSYNETLYYGVWYEMISPNTINSGIELGLFTEKDSTPGSGTIASGATISLLVGITNDTSSQVILNIGTAGSLTSNLNLSDTRTLIPEGWTDALLVTDEVLEQYTGSKTETTTTTRDYSWLSTSSISTSGKATLTLNPGTYKLEVWGAQGGNGYNNATTYAGGKGGYSYGTLTLTAKTTAYVYVGGQGTAGGTTSSVKTGGYNGGGNSGSYRAGSGGGASDIRLGTDSLYARVIVAGGGGGGAYYSRYYGGAGGGTSGINGTGYNTTYNAKAGSISAGGAAGGYATNTKGTAGSFGQGGSAPPSNVDGNNYKRSGGGGGGWFGGGGGGYRSSSSYYYYGTSGGGGGSGWVYTSGNSSYTSSTYTGGTWLLNSSYYLTDAATVAGNTSFTDFSGSTVTGHSGNGAAKITGTEQVETQVQVTTYSIPRVLGLSTLNVTLGNIADLTSGVSVECAEGETGCSLVSTPNIDTSSLSEGRYTVYYTVKDAENKKYKYPRKIVVQDLTSEMVLTSLGLTDLLQEGTPDFSEVATTEEGIYAAEDDLGTSYYFRGASDHNYVLFDNKYWRIIRINGDGSVRMIYDGTSAHEDGESSGDRLVTESRFNNKYGDNAFVGYMNGTTDGTNFPNGTTTSASYSEAHKNTTDSTIKDYLENTWYPTISEANRQYIVDAIYCNDRQVSSANSSYTGDGSGVTKTWYKASERLETNSPATPVLTCSLPNDRFTLESSNFEIETNGKLDAPVGLITADEIVMAGDPWNTENEEFYLYSGNYEWTMTPYVFTGSSAYMFFVNVRLLTRMSVDTFAGGVRPVISLNPSVLKYGTGEIDDPFRISE